jgi:hypothetical protein
MRKGQNSNYFPLQEFINTQYKIMEADAPDEEDHSDEELQQIVLRRKATASTEAQREAELQEEKKEDPVVPRSERSHKEILSGNDRLLENMSVYQSHQF